MTADWRTSHFQTPRYFFVPWELGVDRFGAALYPKTMGFPTENKQCNLRWFIIFKGLEMVWSKECWVGGGWKRRMTCGTKWGISPKKVGNSIHTTRAGRLQVCVSFFKVFQRSQKTGAEHGGYCQRSISGCIMRHDQK